MIAFTLYSHLANFDRIPSSDTPHNIVISLSHNTMELTMLVQKISKILCCSSAPMQIICNFL